MKRYAAALILAASSMTVCAAPAEAERLAEALRIPTVSSKDSQSYYSDIETLNAKTANWFPASSALRVAEHLAPSRVYQWVGSNPSLPPIILLAHLDVVPVDDAESWSHPPFAGAIEEGYIWGRGALDDKSNVLAHLEAVESLIAEGFQPRRSIWLAHGHDEEVDGFLGAHQIAGWLESKGIRAWFTLDEGGAVTEGIIAGIDQPVATIMAGEKGYLSVRMTAEGDGGHSSTPSDQGAILKLSDAITQLRENPLPRRLIPPVETMLDDLAPVMPWPSRLAIRWRAITEPLLLSMMASNPTSAAILHTTMAFTMLKAGVKDNVLPATASAVMNFRILPGDTQESVMAHLRETVTDPMISFESLPGFANDPPPLSDPKSPAMALLRETVATSFPDAISTSGIVVAATDNRHYAKVRENGYYFSPYPYRNDDAGRIHGRDERIAITDYLRMIDFYKTLIRNGAG